MAGEAEVAGEGAAAAAHTSRSLLPQLRRHCRNTPGAAAAAEEVAAVEEAAAVHRSLRTSMKKIIQEA